MLATYFFSSSKINAVLGKVHMDAVVAVVSQVVCWLIIRIAQVFIAEEDFNVPYIIEYE